MVGNWSDHRKEMLQLLGTYSYGVTPPAPDKVWGEVIFENNNAYAGKVLEQQINIHIFSTHGEFIFPVSFYIPKNSELPPSFLHMAIRPVPDKYIPVEEITDAGYALIAVYYQDIVNDNHFGDFSDGLGAYFKVSQNREPSQWGKIGMWAYGASRVLDYILTDRPDLDPNKVSVIGHSRMGKTALWAAAQDERFFCAISNNSGYGGAASSKDGHGEKVQDFINAGSWDWFCENFKEYSGDKENSKPYDQAHLLACIAPRCLCVGSAAEDRGADPESEFLTTLRASQAWNYLGYKGLISPDRMPQAGDFFPEGQICYHLRAGTHFLSREDWNYYIRFLNQKLRKK